MTTMSRFPNTVTPRVVAIGDSIIKGTGAPRGRGWVSLLTRKLNSHGRPYVLVNLAEGGSNAETIHAEMVEECCSLNPRIIILGIGVNDSRFRPSLHRHEIPIGKFREVLTKSLEKIRQRTAAKILVSGQTPVIDRLVSPYKKDKYYRRAWQAPYEGILSELARRYKATYLDNFHHWVDEGERFIQDHTTDGLHPNSLGHLALASWAWHKLNHSR